MYVAYRVESPTADESESDEEMEEQTWRIDRFNKECYLQALRDQVYSCIATACLL